MQKLYVYKDKSNGIIKYVGRTKNLKQRIAQHSNEEKFKGFDWEISYIECSSISQADALESHFISLYHTDLWLNEAKSGWGIIPEFENIALNWKKYKNKMPKIKYSNLSKHCSKISTIGMYDFLDNARNIILDCIENRDREYLINIHLPKESKKIIKSIHDYLMFISIYVNSNTHSYMDGFILKNNNSLQCEVKGNDIYYCFKYSNRSIIHFCLTDDYFWQDCSEIINNFGYQYSGKKICYKCLDGILSAKEANLIWENDYVIAKDLPTFAVPLDNYIKEPLMQGEVVVDEHNNKFFYRYNSRRSGIESVKYGVAHIFPYGKTKKDYKTEV